MCNCMWQQYNNINSMHNFRKFDGKRTHLHIAQFSSNQFVDSFVCKRFFGHVCTMHTLHQHTHNDITLTNQMSNLRFVCETIKLNFTSINIYKGPIGSSNSNSSGDGGDGSGAAEWSRHDECSFYYLIITLYNINAYKYGYFHDCGVKFAACCRCRDEAEQFSHNQFIQNGFCVMMFWILGKVLSVKRSTKHMQSTSPIAQCHHTCECSRTFVCVMKMRHSALTMTI